MRYSIEPRERRHAKGYGNLSFARNIGAHATDAIKTASKRAIQKTAEDLIGNKIAAKIRAKPSASKKSHNEEIQSNEVNNVIPKERYISLTESHQIIDELRLI